MCTAKDRVNYQVIRENIKTVLYTQESAWNSGNIEEYMKGYYHSDSLRFASGGTVRYGWFNTFQGYKKRYPNKETMGKLKFSDLKITVVCDSVAIVFGRWQLQRLSDTPHGLFTLLFKRKEKGWNIVADHTSIAHPYDQE